MIAILANSKNSRPWYNSRSKHKSRSIPRPRSGYWSHSWSNFWPHPRSLSKSRSKSWSKSCCC